jgi:uncharacterized protein with HEPN domain
MSRDYKLYLDDILEAIQQINVYVKDIHTLDEFKADAITMDAVTFRLFVIGEAVKRLPDDIRKKHPQIEWRNIAGLRDIIAHSYFGLKVNILWDVVENKLNALETVIQQLLNEG